MQDTEYTVSFYSFCLSFLQPSEATLQNGVHVKFDGHVIPKRLWLRVEIPDRRFVDFIETVGTISQLKRGSLSVQEELFVLLNERGVITFS